MEAKRKLTPAEEKRMAKFNETEKSLLEQGYQEKEMTISIKKANTLGAVVTISLFIPFIVAFQLCNPSAIKDFIHNYSFKSFAFLVLTMILSLALVVVHELIHGFFWSLGAKNGRKDIEFGYIKEMMTPYCACLSALKRPIYLIGSFAPMFLLGALPLVASILLGNVYLLILGFILWIGGSGDILICFKLLTYKANGSEVLFHDHPTECGLIVFEK